MSDEVAPTISFPGSLDDLRIVSPSTGSHGLEVSEQRVGTYPNLPAALQGARAYLERTGRYDEAFLSRVTDLGSWRAGGWVIDHPD